MFFLFPFLLFGQEPAAPGESAMQESVRPFPLGPLLTTAMQKKVFWRPDWALTIPPDGFSLLSGKAGSITLIQDGQYRVSWDGKGLLREFPVLTAGLQVQVLRNSAGGLTGFSITGSEPPWEIDFIGKEAPLSLARIMQGETVYFAALRYDPAGITETWYDPAGTALANFTSHTGGNLQFLTLRYADEETTEWYHYDSFGNISEIQSAAGIFSALYSQEQCPRYWKRRQIDGSNPQVPAALQNYALQWDGKGFLVRISKSSDSEDPDWLELRYEYTLDAQGNWIERREIQMIRQLGVLVSRQGGTVKRIITY